jgi:hypothetical protein
MNSAWGPVPSIDFDRGAQSIAKKARDLPGRNAFLIKEHHKGGINEGEDLMLRQFALAVLLLGLLLGSLHGAGASGSGGLTIYCWQGGGTGSNLFNKAFTDKWKAVLNPGKNKITMELRPGRERILEMMGKANILYASTHSGIPKKAAEQALQLRNEKTGDYLLWAHEIAAIKSVKPALVVINGCSTYPLIDEEGGKKLNIATALGIYPHTKGRAFIGFEEAHPGPKGDDYFRVFFYFWCGAGNKNYTITEAADKAKEHIETLVNRFGGDEMQKYLLSIGAAEVRKDLRIIGDDNLRYRNLKP